MGRFGVRVTLPDSPYQVKDRLDYLILQPLGDPLPGPILPDLLRQFRSSDAIRFYPARVEQTGRPPAYRIPFVASRTGWRELPTPRLQDFDPDTGKLQTRQVETGHRRCTAGAPDPGLLPARAAVAVVRVIAPCCTTPYPDRPGPARIGTCLRVQGGSSEADPPAARISGSVALLF